jgi:HPt (histidine-containing phosphotransfer) domain-containing protein
MSNDKEIKVVFAPGCFDTLDLDQAELDELMQSIQKQFASMTPEQLAEQGRPLTDEDFDEMPPEVQAQLANPGQGRNLQ